MAQILLFIRSNIRPFLCSLAVCFVLYLSNIVRELPNPDAIWNSVLYKADYNWEISLGRYMLCGLAGITGYSVSPSTYTVIGLVLCVSSGVLIVNMLGLKSFALKMVGIIIFALSPSIQGGVTYYYCFIFYMLAQLFAVTGLYIVDCQSDRKDCFDKKSLLPIVISAVLLCLSFATYQAYIGIIVPVFLLILFKEFFINVTEYKLIVRKIVYFCVYIISGALLYAISNKIVLCITDIRPETQRGFDKAGILTFSTVPSGVKHCFAHFINYYFGSGFLNNDYGILLSRRLCNVVFFVLLAILLIYTAKRNQTGSMRIAFSIILLIMFPVAEFVIVICAPKVNILASTGSIMLPGTTIIYMIMLMILPYVRSIRYLWSVSVVSTGIVIIMLCQLLMDSQSYLRYRMNKLNQVGQSIANEVVKYEDEVPSKKMVIIGTMEDGSYPDNYQYIELKHSIHWTTASYGTHWGDYNGYQYCWNTYLNDYCGVDYYDVADHAKYEEILNNTEFDNMPIFPKEGSVKVVSDVLVVKLS